MTDTGRSEQGAAGGSNNSGPVQREMGYLELIRTEHNFRRLWFGNLVSLFGDWFNLIALLSVVTRYSGSPLALSLVFVAKFLPAAIVSPFAGYLVDRFNRRRLMIVCDVLRAIVVLGLLWVDSRTDVALALVLTAAQVGISSVFQPAQRSAIPNIVSRENLLAANALMAVSWSIMLAFGAAIGGFATHLFGPDAAFVLDSATYLVSAVFILRTAIPQETNLGGGKGTTLAAIRDGWIRMRERPIVGRLALAKAAGAVGVGGLVFLLALVGQLAMPSRPEIGIGLLFAARGIGTGIGPIVARRLFADQSQWPRLIGVLMCITGALYFLVGLGPAILIMAAFVTAAHAASGATWVLSTVLLQQKTVDAYRGRVFATEWLFVMLVDSISIFVAGLLLEYVIRDVYPVVLIYAAVQVVAGTLWMLVPFPPDNDKPADHE